MSLLGKANDVRIRRSDIRSTDGGLPALVGSSPSTGSLSVMSYNLLAEAHMWSLYDPIPDEAKDWEARRALLVDEIVRVNADVVALQEAPLPTFDAEFRVPLEAAGYVSVLQNDKGRAETHETANAILYKADAFEMVFENHRSRTLIAGLVPIVEGRPTQSQLAQAVASAEAAVLAEEEAKDGKKLSKKALKKALAKTRKAVTRPIKDALAESLFFVVCGHLQGHPERVLTRIQQIRSALVKGVAPAVSEWQGQDAKLSDARILICADFNDEQDALVCDLLRQGSLPAGASQTVRDKVIVTEKDVDLAGAQFASAYATVWGAEPVMTFKAPTFRPSAIDFVFYSPSSFVPVAAMDAVEDSYDDLLASSLPTTVHGSDHLPIAVVFDAPFLTT